MSSFFSTGNFFAPAKRSAEPKLVKHDDGTEEYVFPEQRMDVVAEDLPRAIGTDNPDGMSDSSGDVSSGEAVNLSAASTGKPAWVGSTPTIKPGDVHK